MYYCIAISIKILEFPKGDIGIPMGSGPLANPQWPGIYIFCVAGFVPDGK